MKNIALFCASLFTISIAYSQKVHIGLFGGLSAYSGDLTDKFLPKKVTNGAIGITGNYELTDQFMLRGGFTYTIVGGADRFSSKPSLLERNLAFETKIYEFSALAEYYIFNMYDTRYSPYVMAGLAVFHYDPYAFSGGSKIYLRPLSTEGEGLAAYPQRKPYPLTQMAIPFGGGFKYAITEDLRVGVELGLRKLFTDYLDDVSTTYVDPNDLLAAKGQLAVDMSYRGDEVPGGNQAYPSKGAQRGNDKNKDWYYFMGIHLTYRLGGSAGFFGGGKRNDKRFRCPTVPR